jgi:hypothetical protein
VLELKRASGWCWRWLSARNPQMLSPTITNGKTMKAAMNPISPKLMITPEVTHV